MYGMGMWERVQVWGDGDTVGCAGVGGWGHGRVCRCGGMRIWEGEEWGWCSVLATDDLAQLSAGAMRC